MKMSEVFQNLRAEDITSGLGDTEYGLVDDYGIARTKVKAEAAAHAINNHDDLVGANKALVEALEAVMTELIAADRENTWPYEMAEAALAKAKG
jgi:hypothetical protein